MFIEFGEKERVKDKEVCCLLLVLIVCYMGIIVVEMKVGRGFMVGGVYAVFVVVPCKHCLIVM